MPDSRDDGFHRTVSLVRAARTGDRAAREQIFERYLPRIGEMVSLYLGQSLRRLLDHEDLVQESMLRALRALDNFEERSEATFQAYIARIVRNCVVDAQRRAVPAKRGGGKVRREADMPESVFALDQQPGGRIATPSMYARANELERRYEDARLRLKPRHREILGLRDVLEMSYAEICKEMDLGSEDTARSLHFRALRELEKLMGGSAAEG